MTGDHDAPAAGRRAKAAAALGGLAAAGYLAGLAWDWPALRLAAKPLPVACLAAWVVAQPGAGARLLAAGLVLSALGDLLLELPGRFVDGLSAFLFAHLAYAAAFWRRCPELRLPRAVPFALYGVGIFVFLRPRLGAMELPVALYAAAICAMLWRAAACLGAGDGLRSGLALAGALAFAASDTLIALDRFHAPIDGVRYPIILLYWLGQLGIAVSTRPRTRPGLTPAAAAPAGYGP